jgi:uncharacterized membrane protein
VSRRLQPPLPEAAGAVALFIACFVAVHHWFWRLQIVDWPGYRDYGRAIVDQGLVPYRDFAVEYPPGALPVFVVPPAFADYAAAFAGLMGVCGALLVWIVAEIDRRAAFYAALAPVLVGSLILSRFDLWPDLLLAVALLALLEGRDSLGWAFLGAAVSAKLWPLVVCPAALRWSAARGRARSAAAGLAVALAVFLPFAVIAPHGLWASLRGQAGRPLQIESLGAALLTTFGHPEVVTNHGSQNVAGHGGLAALFAALQLVAVVGSFAAFARGPLTRERFLRSAVAAAAGFVAFGKVLSPQFLLWLVPFVPLVRGRRGVVALVLLTAACVLTQVWFPHRYFVYVDTFHLAGVVLARDLVLVALFAVLVLPLREPRPG